MNLFYDFPLWVRTTHWINVLFIGWVIRAGIQILGAYPRLYWNEHSTPGTEWLKLTRLKIPKDRPWIALEQEMPISTWLAQPGGNNLGAGRHWHFAAVIFWILNGVAYVVLMFATGEWRRLVPTSWSIFPEAWHTFVTYITLHIPPPSAFTPFDPLQQLSYFAVIFILAPLLILTGAAQSPAVEAQFPWYPRLFGGRQFARSLHFIGLLLFVAFIILHTALVIYVGYRANFNKILFGEAKASRALTIGVLIGVVAAIVAIYAVTSWYSKRNPRRIQRVLGTIIHPVMATLALHTVSRQLYRPEDISPFFVVNGYPPESDEYKQMRADEWKDWRLDVRGLVRNPLNLTLDDLHAMTPWTQITKHHCIQGWSAIAEWTGVPFRDLIARCQPLPEARYAIVWSYQNDTSGRQFYEAIDLRVLDHPQALLAYAMNGEPLEVPYGAPLRLRVETLLGFKMVKWICAIEFVEDYHSIRDGQGGSREDNMFYERSVSI